MNRFFTRKAIAHTLLLVLTALVTIVVGCNDLRSGAIAPSQPSSSPAPLTSTASRNPVGADNETSSLWVGHLAEQNWMTDWRVRHEGSWGLENLETLPDPEHRFDSILRVHYPAGSASPTVARESGAPLGGAQFLAELGIQPQTALKLSYYIRFSENFDFVKGGKLPGLFGGDGPSGGRIPNGADGFSTRLMWRRQGDGEVYAYLPTSQIHGTSLGRGEWRFRRGVWQHIQEEVILNDPGINNGEVRVWFNGEQVLDKEGLIFRNVDSLKINGLFFSTFFGGGDPTWATPQAVYADFADFSVSAVPSERES